MGYIQIHLKVHFQVAVSLVQNCVISALQDSSIPPSIPPPPALDQNCHLKRSFAGCSSTTLLPLHYGLRKTLKKGSKACKITPPFLILKCIRRIYQKPISKELFWYWCLVHCCSPLHFHFRRRTLSQFKEVCHCEPVLVLVLAKFLDKRAVWFCWVYSSPIERYATGFGWRATSVAGMSPPWKLSKSNLNLGVNMLEMDRDLISI